MSRGRTRPLPDRYLPPDAVKRRRQLTEALKSFEETKAGKQYQMWSLAATYAGRLRWHIRQEVYDRSNGKKAIVADVRCHAGEWEYVLQTHDLRVRRVYDRDMATLYSDQRVYFPVDIHTGRPITDGSSPSDIVLDPSVG